jgi:cytochrome oxidase Cu insertion factor (SCO1/SenC/PrrC family)
MNGVANTEKKRSSVPFWILLAIFAAPVIAAWFFYLNPDFRPAGMTNKGELISPILPLSTEVALLTPEGAELDRSVLEGKWTLVYLAGGECTDACLDRLIAIRQIRLALGESQISVGRLLILTDPAAADLASDLEAKFDGMQVALTDVAGGARLLDQLGEGNAALDRIYILDPMGNLMMRYARNAPAKDTLKDMERLLKASKNWIKGAEYGH